MSEIRITGIKKNFGSVTALESIDLTIHDREFMVLLGASGCGKTTLLRLVAGLEQADGGSIHIGQRRIDQLAPKDRGIAMVFQNYAIFPHMNVAQNIGFGLKMHKTPADIIERRVERMAELLHIEQYLKRYAGELSGGQRQRVALARALAMEPKVILMDEPLSNLDALLRMEMRAELKGVLARSNATAIYVTHDQVEAMSLADRICVMRHGKILQTADPTEIYERPATDFIAGFIGNPPMNFLPAQRQGDGRWDVAGNLMKGPDSAQTHLNFAVRPENLVLAESGFRLCVEVVERLGPHILATGRIQENIFRAILPNDSGVQPQDELYLRPLPDSSRWFEAQSGLSLL